jgi:hypothetical protein
MDSRFEAWMLASGNDPAATKSRISNLRRIESSYGDLDALYAEDGLSSLLKGLTYSTNDARTGAPNPSPMPIDGDLRSGLATLRSAVNKYLRFRQEVVRAAIPEALDDDSTGAVETTAIGEARELTFSLERDLQAALRTSVDQLEPGLRIVDGGREYTVPSGRIDILAEDPSGAQVVIELKAVRATRDAVAQTLAYMGDIAQGTDKHVRGILVAPEFDAKATSAASVVPTLRLVVYGFTFTFTAPD